MSAPVLLMHGVSFTRGRSDEHALRVEPAIRGIDLRVDAGRALVLVGPSGCGKTAVARVANGLAPGFHPGVLEGEAVIEGGSADIMEAVPTTAMVFQHPASSSSPPMSTPNSPSAAGVPLVIMDEPSANLSPAAVGVLARAMRTLKEAGRALLVVEHSLAHLLDRRRGRAHGRRTNRSALRRRRTVEDRRGRGAPAGLALPAHPDAARSRRPGQRARPDSPVIEVGGAQGDPAGAGLVVEALSYSSGRHRVLGIERLDLPAGRVSPIIGDNGAGKTTLVEILCGLRREGRGSRVLLDGERASAGRRLRASALVMQDVDAQLFADDVRAEIGLGAPSADGDRRVDALARALDLTDPLDRHPMTLSGGQKQRVAVAAALAREDHRLRRADLRSGRPPGRRDRRPRALVRR